MVEHLPPLSEVLQKHGIQAKKSFGQNFLLDLNITRKIARLGKASEAYHILEIGPGPGGLTRALFLEGATHVTVIEKDRRFLPLLEEIKASGCHLDIVEGDATCFEITEFPGKLTIIANLPYNVGTLLLLAWLSRLDHITSMTLLFQKEVAERLIAKPGSKAYGRLSVITQLTCDAEIQLNLPREAFTPAPKVDSSLVTLIPKDHRPPQAIVDKVQEITQLTFGQRRKMLRASLKPLLIYYPDMLSDLGLNPENRGEVLTPEDYRKLAEYVIKRQAL